MIDITGHRQILNTLAGVYMLVNKHEVIYIGMSSNMYMRILEHISMGKDFDDVYVMHLADEEGRRVLEMSLICKLQPKLNKIKFDNYFNWFHSFPFDVDYDLVVKTTNMVVSDKNDLHKDGKELLTGSINLHIQSDDAQINESMPTI